MHFLLFGGVGGVGEGGDRSNCKMRMMFLCHEVKLPIHCFKAVEMLEIENSGSKLGKWRADKRKSLLGRDLEWKIPQQSVVLKFLLHTWPLLYCFLSSNARKCILQRALSLFRFNRCIVNILFSGTCITMYEMYFFRHLTALSWAIWKEPDNWIYLRTEWRIPFVLFKQKACKTFHSKIEFDYTDRVYIFYRLFAHVVL